MRRIVVVGGSLSALRMCEYLRSYGWTEQIVVVGDETHLPYDRPPLSKALLKGEVDLEGLAFAHSDQVGDVEWRLGTRAAAVDLEARSLTMADGTSLTYDGIVMATGVRSRRLPTPGPAAGREVLRTIEDGQRLLSHLRGASPLLIVGAGFIGCEVARTARDLGCAVDVVAIDPSAMFVPLGDVVGSEIQRRHEAAGVRFHMGQGVDEFLGDDRVQGARLGDGTVIEVETVLESIGSLPNVGWLEGNGLDLADGVLCDDQLRAGGRRATVVVGDIARFPNDLFASPPRRIEHWQMAIDSARHAAQVLIADLDGGDAPDPFTPMPWFWSEQGSVRISSFGMLGLADSIEILEGDLADEAAIGYFRAGAPVGVVLLGMKSRSARYKRWLQNALASDAHAR